MKLESDILNAVFLCDSEGFYVQSSIQQWFPHLVDKPARSSWKTQMEDQVILRDETSSVSSYSKARPLPAVALGRYLISKSQYTHL